MEQRVLPHQSSQPSRNKWKLGLGSSFYMSGRPSGDSVSLDSAPLAADNERTLSCKLWLQQ